jgi:tetratricopeptide (TPR) repeat protein
VPDVKDFEKIERIIREVGEKELQIGMLPESEEEESVAPPRKGEEVREGGEGEETAGEETLGEETLDEEAFSGETAGAGGEEPLAEVLKDIEVGLSEEKELDEKLREGEGGFSLPLDFDMENLKAEEGPVGEPPEEIEAPPAPPQAAEPPKREPQPRKPKAGGPLEDFESELREIEEKAAEVIPAEEIPEDEALEEEFLEEPFPKGELPAEGISGDRIPQAGPPAGEKEGAEAGVLEEEFVLPDLEEATDFEKEAADLEIPDSGFAELEEVLSPGIKTPPPKEETGGPPAAEGAAPEIGVFEFPEFEEGPSAEGAGPGEGVLNSGGRAAVSASAQKDIEGIGAPDFDWSAAEGPGEMPPELPTAEPAEPPSAREQAEERPPAEQAPVQEEEKPFAEGAPEAEALPGPQAGAPELTLTDEDIILITTKLKQLSRHVAARVRDIIVNAALPDESMKGLLNLLIKDSPEEEVVQYVEWATGKKVAPRKRVPIVPAAPRPRPFEAITENLGPLVRVAALFAAVLLVLGALIFIFVYKPMQANKYYRMGIDQIKAENYRGAEESFGRAVAINEKTREYDNFGWEYMKSGNYDAAEEKFSDGIEREKQKPAWKKTVDLRLHRAQLYNILGRYQEADVDYAEAIRSRPGVYAYESLRGRNLVDWGRSLAAPGKEPPQQLEDAYDLFRGAYAKNRKNSDPIFQMLAIELLKKNDENIHYYQSLLKSRFPQAVNSDVHTELASYLIGKGELDEVWKMLSSVIKRHPDYPRAYLTLSLYYKAIDNREAEEKALEAAIERENGRELLYPWEVRDRRLISDSYNNIGEIYARTTIPGLYAEAINFFKRAVEADESNAKVYFNLGQAYFYGEKDFDLARSSYERAKALGLENNDLRYNLGAIYFFAGEFEPALRQWTPLSEMYTDNPNIGFALGTLFLYLKKYQAALGEFLWLTEYYERLIEGLGPVKSNNPYHRDLVLKCAAAYNNMGVSYQKLYEAKGNREHQKDALVSLYRGGELADLTGVERGRIQYNIQYIMHPKVIRSDMAIDNGISDNYRFTIR